MAWWNQPEGSVTPTVTLRRLAAWLAERGYSYDIDLSEGLVRFSVAGLDHVLMVVDRRILAVRAHHQLPSSLPGAAELSRVRAVAQEVSSGRLIPAFYTEVDDAGLGLCAEVLTNIGAGLDDAQLAGTMDFVLDGVDEALRELIGRFDTRADSQSDAGSEVEIKAEDEAAGEEGQTAIVIALPEATGPAGSAGSAEPGDAARPVDAVEPFGEKAAHASPDTPVEAVPDAVSDAVADTTLEMAAVVDVPGTDTHAEPREPHAEPDIGVKGDEGMAAPGDADGGTEVETTDTPEPLLVS